VSCLRADDSILFYKASYNQALVIRNILSSYAKALGKKVNFGKTNVMFCKEVPQACVDDIVGSLGIKEVLTHDKYLGFYIFISTKKNNILCTCKIKFINNDLLDESASLLRGREKGCYPNNSNMCNECFQIAQGPFSSL